MVNPASKSNIGIFLRLLPVKKASEKAVINSQESKIDFNIPRDQT